MSRTRSILLPTLLVAAVALLLASRTDFASPRAFLPAVVGDADTEEGSSGFQSPLEWLHYDVILAARTSYPLALMIGFTCYGNVLLRKECADKPYPNWLFGWPLGFMCYTYPGAVVSDLFFVPNAPLRAMTNNNIFLCFSFWYILVQNSDRVYKLLTGKHTFIFLTAWFLADATRASLLFLERAVAHQAVFARGVWQAFIWCSAGPIVRVAERCLRGEQLPPLDKLQPNSLNVLKFPLVMMFWNMIFYLVYLGYFSDCKLFENAEDSLNMVECGARYKDLYAACTYVPVLLHIARGYWNLYAQGGKAVFGETFCMGACK